MTKRVERLTTTILTAVALIPFACPILLAQVTPVPVVPSSPAGDAPAGPLRLTIGQLSPQPFFFQAYLRNTGDQILRFSLGFLDVGWNTMPSIQLVVKDAAGEAMPLDLRYVYGDDLKSLNRLIQPRTSLAPGEVFSFPIILQDYLRRPLAPGEYTVQARYVPKFNEGALKASSDTWASEILSNSVKLSIPERDDLQKEGLPEVRAVIQQSNATQVFSFGLQNVGGQPVRLTIGGGKWFDLTLIDAEGARTHLRTHAELEAEAESARRRISSEGGIRLHSIILQSGEIPSFPFSLADYSSPDHWMLSLTAGRYTLEAKAAVICVTSPDQPAKITTSCRQGNVVATLPFSVP